MYKKRTSFSRFNLIRKLVKKKAPDKMELVLTVVSGIAIVFAVYTVFIGLGIWFGDITEIPITGEQLAWESDGGLSDIFGFIYWTMCGFKAMAIGFATAWITLLSSHYLSKLKLNDYLMAIKN